MWISELARRSALPVATVKFYLREGLLPAGTATGATRASYDGSHLRRLRLIRALVEVAGLRLDAVRTIVDAVEDTDRSLHAVVGSAHRLLSATEGATSASEHSRSRVADLVRRQQWQIEANSAHEHKLAQVLDHLESLDFPVPDELLDLYATAMAPVADMEVGTVATSGPERATETAVIGTLLLEPALLMIRRLAHENVSSRELQAPSPAQSPARPVS